MKKLTPVALICASVMGCSTPSYCEREDVGAVGCTAHGVAEVVLSPFALVHWTVNTVGLEPMSPEQWEAHNRQQAIWQEQHNQQMENYRLQQEQQQEHLRQFSEQNRRAACSNWGSCY